MVVKIKNALISAFFGALGPFFNKQATTDKDRTVVIFFDERDIGWMIYPFNVVCIILMLWVNTVAVKYKMLSYKYDGAFLGTSLIFILGYIFSAAFDFLYDGTVLTPKKTLGAIMMILGIILISLQEEADKVIKKTNSFYEIIHQEDDQKSNPIRKPMLTADNDDDDDPPLLDIAKSKKQKSNKTNSKANGKSSTNDSERMPSRHKPGAISNLDFIQMRKGFI
jgi:uncharacterized membrane protein